MHFFLSALARLTGALDGFGEPLVFDTAGDNPLEDEIVAAILAAIAATVTVPIDINLMTSGVVPAGLAVGILPAVVPDVGPGDQACFGVKFTGTDSPVGSFDLNFKDDGSGAVLGTIPVDVDCPESPESVPDHFKCYKARATGFKPLVVHLADQFVSLFVGVQRLKAICNPVDKDDKGISDPTAHLTCYNTRTNSGQPLFEPRNVVVENQFGELELAVSDSNTLCVPSKKNGVPADLNLDHFRCYDATVAAGSTFKQRIVTLTDQFLSYGRADVVLRTTAL